MSLKKRLERLKVKVAKVNKPVTAPASSGDDGPGREFWGSLPAAICIALFDARRAAGGEGRPLAELLAELKLPPRLRDQVDDAMRHGKWRGDPNPLIVTQE